MTIFTLTLFKQRPHPPLSQVVVEVKNWAYGDNDVVFWAVTDFLLFEFTRSGAFMIATAFFDMKGSFTGLKIDDALGISNSKEFFDWVPSSSQYGSLLFVGEMGSKKGLSGAEYGEVSWNSSSLS